MLIVSCLDVDLKRRQKHLLTIQDLAQRPSHEPGLGSTMPIAWPDAFVITMAGGLPEQVIVQQPFDVVVEVDCHLPSAMTLKEIRLVVEAANSVVHLGSRSPVPAEDNVLFGPNKHGVKEKHLLCSSTLEHEVDKNPNSLKQFPGVKCVFPKPQFRDLSGEDCDDRGKLSAVSSNATLEPGRQLLAFPLQVSSPTSWS